MAADVAREVAAGKRAGRVVGRVDDTAERGVRELGVDRHEAAADGDRRIDDLAVLEAMLKREVRGGEHVFEQALEQHLAKLAARLGRSQHLLQTGDVAADLEHLARRCGELAELVVDRAHRVVRGCQR